MWIMFGNDLESIFELGALPNKTECSKQKK